MRRSGIETKLYFRSMDQLQFHACHVHVFAVLRDVHALAHPAGNRNEHPADVAFITRLHNDCLVGVLLPMFRFHECRAHWNFQRLDHHEIAVHRDQRRQFFNASVLSLPVLLQPHASVCLSPFSCSPVGKIAGRPKTPRPAQTR